MNLIVAVDNNWGIGKDNKLLVSIPADMKYFRTQTKDSVVIMGRKTLESFPGGEPLKNRINIVITKDENYKKDGVVIVHSVDDLCFLFCRRRRAKHKENSGGSSGICNRIYHCIYSFRSIGRYDWKPFDKISDSCKHCIRIDRDHIWIEFPGSFAFELLRWNKKRCEHRKYGILFSSIVWNDFFHRLDTMCWSILRVSADAGIYTGSYGKRSFDAS